MSKFDKTIGGVNLIVFNDQVTATSEVGFQPLTLEDIGHLAQFCAVAWEALAGEEYKPVVISERGYVAQKGIVYAGEYVIPKRAVSMPGLDALEKLERDCE